MLKVYLGSLSSIGPGFKHIDALSQDLQAHTWDPQPIEIPTLSTLPPREARRITPLIKLALAVSEQVYENNAIKPHESSCIFANQSGDTHTMDYLASALSEPEPMISPTKFHNSLLNAPIGYWSIAHQIHHATTALSAGEYSFASGLLEAACMCQDPNTPSSTLLTCYDIEPPPPLNQLLEVRASMGVGMILSDHKTTDCNVSLELSLTEDVLTPLACVALQPLYDANATGKSLPLIEKVVKAESGKVVLPYSANQNLTLHVNFLS